jgi:hypothetical protein
MWEIDILKEMSIERVAPFIASPIKDLANNPNLFPKKKIDIWRCIKKVRAKIVILHSECG